MLPFSTLHVVRFEEYARSPLTQPLACSNAHVSLLRLLFCYQVITSGRDVYMLKYKCTGTDTDSDSDTDTDTGAGTDTDTDTDTDTHTGADTDTDTGADKE